MAFLPKKIKILKNCIWRWYIFFSKIWISIISLFFSCILFFSIEKTKVDISNNLKDKNINAYISVNNIEQGKDNQINENNNTSEKEQVLFETQNLNWALYIPKIELIARNRRRN